MKRRGCGKERESKESPSKENGVSGGTNFRGVHAGAHQKVKINRKGSRIEKR